MREKYRSKKIPDVSEFYNPFSIQYFGPTESFERYKEFIMTNDVLKEKLKNIDVEAFGCYCTGEQCHTPTLIECLIELKENDVERKINFGINVKENDVEIEENSAEVDNVTVFTDRMSHRA